LRSKLGVQRLSGLVLVAGAVACSLVVDTAEIDAGCDPGKKLCDGTCVGIDDPTYGCKRDRCLPCQRDALGVPFGDRLIPKCKDFECVVASCAFGYGCEGCKVRLLTDPSNCGTCGRACADDETCSRGECRGPAGGVGGAAGAAGEGGDEAGN